MTGWTKTLHNLSRRLDDSVLALSVGFLVLMLALVLFQVFARYGFSNAPAWTEEAARYAMIWCGLLGGVSAFSAGIDPSVVSINEQSSLTRQRLKHWASFLCVFVFLVPLFLFSLGFVARASLRTTEALNWNFAWIAIVLPIYCVLILIQALLKLSLFEIRRRGENHDRPAST